MNALAEGAVYWDPYRPDIFQNPYPFFKRLREEAPLYYNEQYDFYAVSRFSDVESALVDKETFSSSRGDILEYIKSNQPVPKGMFIWEDPPIHTAHRGVLMRIFTPKRMNDLEQKVRAYCARSLDPLVGAGQIDFIADLGAQMPMRVIGMLLGIPEEDQVAIRESVDAALRTEAGKPMDVSKVNYQGEGFEEYIEWRTRHPSDDLMTELLNVEFQDETGTRRKLSREEILIFVNVIAGAGNETTTRLIGWTGKVLGDHPDQRAELARNPALIPNAIEELLRFEPPGPSVARYVTRDIEIHGRTVPAGSAALLLNASANRDERRYPNADRFDIHRQGPPHITFGRGIHACLGSALARVEGRVALDELLKRFPEWTVDLDNAKLSSTSTVRGWDTLPAYLAGHGRSRAVTSSPASTTAHSIPGSETWELTLATPMGAQKMTARIVRSSDSFAGSITGEMGVQEIKGKVVGNTLSWTVSLSKPVSIKLGFEATIEGDSMTGNVKLGMFGNAPLTGKRV
ncbi:MAG TPA: cytochrome P450 [Steroidobacter sp.]